MMDSDWDTTVQRYRKTQIGKLRAIIRKDIDVTEEQRAEIERAARGIWWSRDEWTPEPPARWNSENRTREYGSAKRGR